VTWGRGGSSGCARPILPVKVGPASEEALWFGGGPCWGIGDTIRIFIGLLCRGECGRQDQDKRHQVERESIGGKGFF